jgi:hypothetical protein
LVEDKNGLAHNDCKYSTDRRERQTFWLDQAMKRNGDGIYSPCPCVLVSPGLHFAQHLPSYERIVRHQSTQQQTVSTIAPTL